MSIRRGYLETQDGRKRLRIVKEGYNADDPDVPVNAVLFDSESDGMGSVLRTGETTVPSLNNFYAQTTGMWVEQWDYDFVPLVLFTFLPYPQELWNHSVWALLGEGANMPSPRITVSQQGIRLRGAFGKIDGGVFRVRWVAFRINAYD